MSCVTEQKLSSLTLIIPSSPANERFDRLRPRTEHGQVLDRTLFQALSKCLTSTSLS